jgi:hypothetical protein
MIRHIVLWRLAAPAKSPDGSLSSMPRIERNIASMREQIDGLRRIEIGLNVAPGPDASDLALIADFDSWEALRGYEKHPLHDELRALIGPLRTERRVVDQEI